ncbi:MULTISPECIES: hypothetical protein [Arthrobacter]|uniref:Uncharacterized protein n=1 Tax=Arthrobacter terricola TaxID=2547396 RepID=A0A4R5KAP8_9MICC|nr:MULTISPECIES: hypothetical protein [Arthrobacter]MBT8163271.1 hypothetical protein [Arthrobacter sp. GN70]TDF91187.1 hypothetical protein E1809_21490 [Arthrobacter terricola]
MTDALPGDLTGGHVHYPARSFASSLRKPPSVDYDLMDPAKMFQRPVPSHGCARDTVSWRTDLPVVSGYVHP